MKQLLLALPVALSVAAPLNAFGAADCPEYPRDEWMSVLDMQKMIVNEYGFEISRFKIDDECYEIYGWETNEAGERQKIEVYFDAKTGAIVKKEDD
jgi:hypothetical protein